MVEHRFQDARQPVDGTAYSNCGLIGIGRRSKCVAFATPSQHSLAVHFRFPSNVVYSAVASY